MTEASYQIIALEGIDGAGKTAVAKALELELSDHIRVLRCRLSAQMGGVLRTLVDDAESGDRRYQDVIPAGFRVAAYLVDAAVQFRYEQARYQQYDLLIFDRWLPTYDVYCAGGMEALPNADWYRRLTEVIPAPGEVFHLVVDPAVAAARVRHRGDWTATHWSQQQLRADLSRLASLYETAMDPLRCRRIDAGLPLGQVVDAILGPTWSLLSGAELNGRRRQ